MNSIKPTTLNNLFSLIAKVLITASIFFIASIATAQNFPNKTIKILIPFQRVHQLIRLQELLLVGYSLI